MRASLLALALLASLPCLAQSPVAATVEGRAELAARALPRGHPVQGFSSINLRPDGTYWVLGDTHHAAQHYREDVRVVFHHVYVDFLKGGARLLSAAALHDPDRKLPFRIATEGSPGSFVTTADLNVDAMQVLDTTAWFADDLGPLLVESDLRGRVLSAYAAPVAAAAVRRGFGGLSALPGGRFLYAAFEGALWLDGRWETGADARQYARILEFDLLERRFTGRTLRYRLEADGNAIADLALIDARSALVVERGAGWRRVYRVALDGDEARKIAFAELGGLAMGVVEGVAVVPPWYVVLSDGQRREFVLLRSPDLLAVP